MPPPDVDEDVRDLLEGAIGSLTKGTNLFTGGEKPPVGTTLDLAVFVRATGGTVQQRSIGGATGRRFEEASVQIMVRGDREDPASARTLARECHAALERPTGLYAGTGALGSYASCFPREPPNQLQPDDSDRPVWVFNADLTYDLTSP
jgi:hypothetical protein